MDEYLIYGESLRKIAGEARRLINSKAEMDPDEIYVALCKVSPGGGKPLPSSDGVAFSSTQITPDEDYRVNYNFMAQVVYHVQRMIGSKENMTKEQIIEGLSEIIFIPQARIKAIVDLLTYESTTNAWVPEYQVETAHTEIPQLTYDTGAVAWFVKLILTKAWLNSWTYDERHVAAESSGVVPKTTWKYKSEEQNVDTGRMTSVKVVTNDLVNVSGITLTSSK